ncbi:hypothetical protein QJQ45_019262 [Haematococcus lacustris]|nr:hypothetical protein QJQ45_019262 [Haematococcus lacustris]
MDLLWAMWLQALDYQPPPPPLLLGPSLGPDTTPPLLTLLGDPAPSVPIYSPYVDAGCLAVDARDGVVAVRVAGFPDAANWTSTATRPGQPIQLTYTARDRAGNTASVTRSIKVVDACTAASAQEFTCPTSLQCSVNGNCGAAAAALSSLFGPSGSSGGGGSAGPRSATALAALAALTVPDTTPPVITIQGMGQLFQAPRPGGSMVTGMLTTVMLGSQYADEGATAYDVRTGQPGLRIDLTARIKVTYPVAIDTSAPTDPAKPYLVLYDVSDDATPPNMAQQVRRRVQVVCPTGEVLCPGTDDPNLLSCSFNRICGLGPSASSTSTTASSTALAPPALTLLGPSVMRIRQGAPYLPCSGGQVRGCEQGAVAIRQVHGDTNAEIRLCADKALAAGIAQPLPYQQVGLLYCGLDTAQPGRYPLTFTAGAASQQGPAAAVTRTLVVEQLCEPGESLCSDGLCSADGGSCLRAGSATVQQSSAASNTPPSLAFAAGKATPGCWPAAGPACCCLAGCVWRCVHLPPWCCPAGLAGSTVAVRRGWQYLLCPDGVAPEPDKPCEPGVIASDQEDGQAIESQVLLCPPADCYDSAASCVGHRAFEKDILACGIDTSAADIGSTFSLVFQVYDSGGLSASLARVVVVVSPCATEEFYCDGTCSKVECSTLASLPDASQASPQVTSVVLLPSAATNTTQAANANATVFMEYGRLAPFSLLPCPSSQALGSAAVSCAAVALDSLEGDVSAALQEPMDIRPDARTRCSAASLTAGTCLPGFYVMAYTATNTNATSTATALLNVFVEQRSVTRLNYSFVSPAASAPEAQLLAAQLLTNTSLVNSLVVATQLPAFGLAPAYQPYASPPVQQRVVQAVVQGARAEQASASTWLIALQLELTTASCAPLDLTGTLQQLPGRRLLSSLGLHPDLVPDLFLAAPGDALLAGDPDAEQAHDQPGRGMAAHVLAAVQGSKAAAQELHTQFALLHWLLQPTPGRAALRPDLATSLVDSSAHNQHALKQQPDPEPEAASTAVRSRALLQSNSSSSTSSCGSALTTPAITSSASLPGSLVSASVAAPSCSTAAASTQASAGQEAAAEDSPVPSPLSSCRLLTSGC